MRLPYVAVETIGTTCSLVLTLDPTGTKYIRNVRVNLSMHRMRRWAPCCRSLRDVNPHTLSTARLSVVSDDMSSVVGDSGCCVTVAAVIYCRQLLGHKGTTLMTYSQVLKLVECM
jgi:hypothetical protein